MALGKGSAPVRAPSEKLWAALKATARAAETLASELQGIDPGEGSDALKQARADTMRLTLACLDLAVSVGKLEATSGAE